MSLIIFTYSGEDIVMQEWIRTDKSVKGKETYEYVNHHLTKLQSWFLDESDNTWKKGNYKTFEYSDDTYNVSEMTFTNPFLGQGAHRNGRIQIYLNEIGIQQDT